MVEWASPKSYRNELKVLYKMIECDAVKKCEDEYAINDLVIVRGKASKEAEKGKKILDLNHLFISFDKLYDIIHKLNGKDIGKALWYLSRIQVKNSFTMNHVDYLLRCLEGK